VRAVPYRDQREETMGAGIYHLSASSLTFLITCPRCFWRTHRLRRKNAREPFPQIFSQIDKGMKSYLHGRRTVDVVATMPPGYFGITDRYVKSVPLAVPGHSDMVVLLGHLDELLKLDDGTPGMSDLKTAVPNPEHLAFYSRQLHTYTLCVENPAPGYFAVSSPVSAMGLLTFNPADFDKVGLRYGLLGALDWVPFQRDDAGFFAFLGEVLTILEEPDAATVCARV
jgi:hypothetical protein